MNTIDQAPDQPRFVSGYARVLIVDDDPAVREIAGIILTRAGYDVVAAASPAHGVAALKSQPAIDIVLIDIVMPEMSGYDLADEVRQIIPGARIVFMSGFAGDIVRRQVDEPFLLKPFTAKSLTDIIDRALVADPCR